MNASKLAKYFDHTLLKANAKEEDFRKLVNQANQYNFFSICIPSTWIEFASKIIKTPTKICTVVGFPLGHDDSSAKKAETQKALEKGAEEIDMVINISKFLSGESNFVEQEIRMLKKICDEKVLKVIVETAYLNQSQIKDICKIINNSGADFFKTSTGFAHSGAQIEDIILARTILEEHVAIKASGGIRDLETTLKFIEAGADRIGASASHQIIKELTN